jgi:ribosomal protein S18 acetylase RimI-like enzyme
MVRQAGIYKACQLRIFDRTILYMGDFVFKGFQQKDVSRMRKAFNKAFSDYIVPIQLSHGQFVQKIIQKTNISFKYSVGSYYNKHLVGFIYNSINLYEDKKTAYNGGTGVITDFRGNQLTRKMYESVFPKLHKNGIEQCVLEVISNNKPAIKVYENLGFKRTKFYHCLKLKEESQYLQKIKKYTFDVVIPEKPKWNKYQHFCDYNTCFLDSFPLLKKNKQNETILEVYHDQQLVGFLIFNRKMGRVEQIGIDHKARGQGIGTMLIKKMIKICRKKSIYILNLNERNYGLINFFLRLGFRNEIDQFEFKLSLESD